MPRHLRGASARLVPLSFVDVMPMPESGIPQVTRRALKPALPEGISTMDHDEIREHIDAAAARQGSHAHSLTSRILRSCWPGGSDDRTEPAALAWLRQWRPDRMGTPLPACSCTSGHCLVCN